MRSITVVGQGATQAVPDAAVLDVAAVHHAPSMSEALAGAESARAFVVATARDFTDAVASRDLSVWSDRREPGEPLSFGARHSLTIRCPDLAQAGALVGTLVDQAGDRLEINHVALTVSDESEAVVRAREAAFADGRSKAEHLARLAGATLGEVESVVEGRPAQGRPFALAAAKADVSLEPGETTISESLTVTWQLL